MKILITGATGFIGSALADFLKSKAHTLFFLSRKKQGSPDHLSWDPAKQEIESRKLEGMDAVVHLGGESIMGRWTEEKKRRILESRVQGTDLLSRTLSGLAQKPRVLICASAMGYYGDRQEAWLTEESSPGKNFLSQVCQAWEKACEPAVKAGIRVAHIRIGMVLSPGGGALKKMLLPFKLGLGGKIGSGAQYMSWVTLDDLLKIMEFSMTHDEVKGPVNAVGPEPVTNFDFTKTLGRVLHRPTIFPMPAFAARLVFGQMADELLLSSTRVKPEKLLKAGFRFDHAYLESALKHLLS
jgi:uncharacterized protein (TIGR01777 family)